MQSTLVGSDSGSGDSFGKAVAVHAGILLVGAPTKTVGSASSAGMVYQFSLIDGSWTELGSYDPGDLAQYDRLGWSVAAGSYAVIGIPGDISSAPGRALVWTFCE